MKIHTHIAQLHLHSELNKIQTFIMHYVKGVAKN